MPGFPLQRWEEKYAQTTRSQRAGTPDFFSLCLFPFCLGSL